ncbi:MAG TPA: S41 family peptidase, partial [Ramlibacter sp.]
MKQLYLIRSLAAIVAGSLLLASCGGGGGGGAPRSPYGTSAQFAEIPGDPESCSVARQKSFVRAYIDEVYLWYREVPTVDASQYTTTSQVDDYFDALTNLPKDEFSTAIFSGQSAPVQSLVAASQPSPGNLLAAHIVPTPTFPTSSGGRQLAYVQLRNHQAGAQDELIAAFRAIQAHTPAVQDVILDLRDNTGGFVYVALTAASMISGPASNGQLFERFVFNDKRGETSLLYSGKVQFQDAGASTPNPVGTDLPQLGLSRVFILTNGDTCSASESIINSLRGVNVTTIRIGETTCGKPFGFTEKVNCGYSFFPIEFQGFNAQGFGDYQAGFAPACQITDNTRSDPTQRGTATDLIYTTAVAYDTAGCPTAAGTGGVQSAGSPIV